MTDSKELFSNLEEKHLQVHIKMGDDGRYSATNIGIVTFQEESGSPFTLKDFMYVLHLKKNLASITMLEDHGYNVIFSKVEDFLRHIALGQVNQIEANEELLNPKEEPQDDVEEPQDDVEHPHVEEKRVEAPTHAKNSTNGRKCAKEYDILMHDARENVGAPTAHRGQKRSPNQYIGCMALMSESVGVDPSSFEEALQQPIWIDAMVKEYDSIIRKNVWEVVPRPIDKSMVSSIWLYKVKQVVDGSVEKHKAKFVAIGLFQVEGIDYNEAFAPITRYSSIRSIISVSV
eukprot:PITA_27246